MIVWRIVLLLLIKFHLSLSYQHISSKFELFPNDRKFEPEYNSSGAAVNATGIPTDLLQGAFTATDSMMRTFREVLGLENVKTNPKRHHKQDTIAKGRHQKKTNSILPKSSKAHEESVGKVGVVLITHEVSPTIITTLRLLSLSHDRYPVTIMYDSTHGLSEEAFPSELPFKKIAFSRPEEEKRYPNQSYITFSGIYGAPAKPAEIHYMSTQKEFEHVWFIEGDVFFTGGWGILFDDYAKNNADLIAPQIHLHDVNFPSNWPYYTTCDIATNKYHSRAFVPVHRISTSLSKKIFDYVLSGQRGHHECVMGTICEKAEGCTMEQIPRSRIGRIRYRPRIFPQELLGPFSETLKSSKSFHRRKASFPELNSNLLLLEKIDMETELALISANKSLAHGSVGKYHVRYEANKLYHPVKSAASRIASDLQSKKHEANNKLKYRGAHHEHKGSKGHKKHTTHHRHHHF